MTTSWIGFLAALTLASVSALVSGCDRPIVQPVPATTPDMPKSLVGTAFPLQRRPGLRYLVGQSGRPFLIHGEAAWTLLVRLTREEVDRYLEDRQRRGINTLLIDLLEVDLRVYGISGASSPRNVYGEAPFLDPGDYTRPNEKYFAHVDWVLKRAAEHGFLVLLTPSYLGYEGGDQGWYRAMRRNGPERLRAYGRYLGSRYRKMKNIVWVLGGDYDPPERTLIQAIVNGLRETDPDALLSFHGSRGTAARAFLDSGAAWLDLNTIYTDEDSVVAAAHTEYAASTLPFILIEGRYEGEGASEATVRAQAYQAMLSGACGQLMGNKWIWLFDQGWEKALDSPGARSPVHMRSILEAIHWWQLQPAYDGFVVNGVGTGIERAVSAVAADRRQAIVYMPSQRTITLNTKWLIGPKLEVRWIDPTNEHSETVAGSPLATSPNLELRAPERNGSGYGDWLLELKSTK